MLMRKGGWIFVLMLFCVGVATALAAKPSCGDGKCNGGETSTT